MTCKKCGKNKKLKKDLCPNCYQMEYNRSKPWEWRALLCRGNAEQKARSKTLSHDFLKALREDTPNCKCCGVTLDYNQCAKGSRPDNLATLDQILPHSGYFPSNVAIICFSCNYKKNDLTLSDLQMITDYIRSQVR